MVFGVCKQCGGETKSQYRSQLRDFCSHKCSNQWKWDNIREHGDYSPNYVCDNCGKEFYVAKNRLKTDQEFFFCSHKCWAEHFKKRNSQCREYRECVICGNFFYKHGVQTCSKECGNILRSLTAFRKRINNPQATLEDMRKIQTEIQAEKNARMNRIPIYSRREKDYMKEYNQSHKKDRAKREMERISSDPIYKFKVKMRKKMSQWFRRRNTIKDEPTEKILGCSILEFREYIASKFKEGMSWFNYGEWHLDHIIPLATANTIE